MVTSETISVTVGFRLHGINRAPNRNKNWNRRDTVYRTKLFVRCGVACMCLCAFKSVYWFGTFKRQYQQRMCCCTKGSSGIMKTDKLRVYILICRPTVISPYLKNISPVAGSRTALTMMVYVRSFGFVVGEENLLSVKNIIYQASLACRSGKRMDACDRSTTIRNNCLFRAFDLFRM